jgi:hypothetical protein
MARMAGFREKFKVGLGLTRFDWLSKALAARHLPVVIFAVGLALAD